MTRILTLSVLGGVFVVVLAAAALSLVLPRVAAAQGHTSSLIWPDSNGNGIIDIAELFDVIDFYFSGDPIPAPEPHNVGGCEQVGAEPRYLGCGLPWVTKLGRGWRVVWTVVSVFAVRARRDCPPYSSG